MPPVRYRDLWFRMIASAIAAHFVVMYGVKASFFEVLVQGYYHIPMLSSFLIAFLLFAFVRFVSIRLDKKFDWRLRTLYRIPLQLLFGLLIPGLFAFLLAYAYFGARGVNIINTLYLRIDYPVILLLILLLNVYYLVYYIIAWLKQAEQAIPHSLVSETNDQRKTFLVNRGAKNIPVPLDDIAYFFRSNNNYLRTFGGDDYTIAQPLDEVEQQLSGADFFRANRQLLVSRNACKHFETLPYNKLALIIEPNYKEQVVISQKRSRAFKEWVGK